MTTYGEDGQSTIEFAQLLEVTEGVDNHLCFSTKRGTFAALTPSEADDLMGQILDWLFEQPQE